MFGLSRKARYRRKIHRYLTTDKWRARSLRFRQRVGYQCAGCGLVSRRNHTHHLDYSHAFDGREPDRDLMCLCWRCHAAVHSFARRYRGSLRAATLEWVRRNRHRYPVRR